VEAAVTYPELLTKAVREPEQLTPEEQARLLPEDRAHIVAGWRREIAKIDAEIAGHMVLPRTVSDRRADDLVRLARKGQLRYFRLPLDEQQAIENTPGLWARLWEAWA
jgi:hypothetical protein